MDPLKNSDSLPSVLASWRLQVRREPDFRAGVRARLAAGGVALPWGDFLRQHAAWVGGALAVAIISGAVFGHGRARSQVVAERARLAAAYVEGLDARMSPGR